MKSGPAALPVVVGITLCTASAVLFYKWYKSRNSTPDETVSKPRSKFKAKEKQQMNQSQRIEFKVAKDTVPLVIGRNGATLNAIEEKTGAKVAFRDKDAQNQMCEISGPYESVMKAHDAINDVIRRSQNVTEFIIIPKSTHDKIGVKVLKDINHETATKISIDGGLEDKMKRKLKITGSAANVQKAKQLLEDQVRQDTADRENESKREPRYSQKNSPINSSMESLSKKSSSPQPAPSAGLLSNSDNFNRISTSLGGQMEVYVSAVASPARFWVQIVGPQINRLDALISEMTTYYSEKENQNRHRISDPYLGQIVAAMFQYDSKWYRAEIVAIVPNEFDPRRVALDLYFLDFGDSIFVDPHDVFELRTDFLTLRYQAIECFLANVQPVHPLEGGQWNHDAINKFEDLTQVAKWKKLIAKTVKTRDRFKGFDSNPLESSTIPGIELYDIVDDRELSLASVLILENYAVPDNQDDVPTPLSRYSSSESVLRLDGGDTSSNGSVAEKAMMFELTAHIQNTRNSPRSSAPNGDGHRSPSKFSPSPRKQKTEKQKPNKAAKELNGSAVAEPKAYNFQETQQLLMNQSWGDIMDAES